MNSAQCQSCGKRDAVAQRAGREQEDLQNENRGCFESRVRPRTGEQGCGRQQADGNLKGSEGGKIVQQSSENQGRQDGKEDRHHGHGLVRQNQEGASPPGGTQIKDDSPQGSRRDRNRHAIEGGGMGADEGIEQRGDTDENKNRPGKILSDGPAATSDKHGAAHQHESQGGMNRAAQKIRGAAGLTGLTVQARKLVQHGVRQRRQRSRRMRSCVFFYAGDRCHASPQALKSLSQARLDRLTRH